MTSRPLSLAPLFLLVFACNARHSPVLSAGADADTSRTEQAIVDVEQSAVKRQSIGNCWIYATASWAESLHKAASGEELNMSESYWTYWNWFDQISLGFVGGSAVETGGSFALAADIIRKYGWMAEGDFIAAEASSEKSQRQAQALAAINQSLASGALSDYSARTNAALVRQELDKAWALDASVSAALTQAFSADASRNLQNGAQLSGTHIHGADSTATDQVSPSDVPGQPQHAPSTLALALDAWTEVGYPSGAGDRRGVQIRMQRALHDRQPVIISWFVDFNAVDDQGRFLAPPTTPGRQGGHMVVLEDYEIGNVPGFGTLPAGVVETRTAALQAALDPSAVLSFLRVKNSWGNYHPVPNWIGYHDLYTAYLDADLKRCAQDADENSDPNNCPWTAQGLDSLVLPPGY